ncbi:MAG: choice-of-anchor X domain-containing protein [Telluria sp.]
MMPLLLVLAVGAAWFLAVHGRTPPASAAATSGQTQGTHFFDRLDRSASTPGAAEHERRYQILLGRYERVKQTFCNYRDSSKYPPESRPVSQNPDQIYPNLPVAQALPVSDQGAGGDRNIRVLTSQSHVYVAAGEAVTFSLRAVDAGGNTVPLVVTRAVAHGVTFGNARKAPQVPLAFVDDGSGADAVANDGILAATLNPGQTGLAGFQGPIDADVQFNAGGRNGAVQFEVIYSPESPASWTGQVREAQENGSLVFYLAADVRVPGRYVVTGRVDDARGRPFALATFNDLLGPGVHEVPLTVFGKLVRDGAPAVPLTLRDVEGYLLKENADPDRALMARLEGRVYVSKQYPLDSFSDAEWQSEQRSRYLKEFSKDLRGARADLAAFDPARPMPASGCAPAGRGGSR